MSRGGRSPGLSAPSNALIMDSDWIVVKPIGAKTEPPARIDLKVTRDTVAFVCDAYHLFIVGASSGTIYGHAYLTSRGGFGACHEDISIPLSEAYQGTEKVQLLLFDGDYSKKEVKSGGVTPANAWRSSSAFRVIPTDQGRDGGQYVDGTKTITEEVAEGADSIFGGTGFSNIESTVRWGTIGVASIAGLYFAWPFLMAFREGGETLAESATSDEGQEDRGSGDAGMSLESGSIPKPLTK